MHSQHLGTRGSIVRQSRTVIVSLPEIPANRTKFGSGWSSVAMMVFSVREDRDSSPRAKTVTTRHLLDLVLLYVLLL
jgi:hypothetical protein